MRTAAASLTGLGILVTGTGLLGHDRQVLVGVLTLAYGLAVFISLALRDSIYQLGLVFDAWAEWEPETLQNGESANLQDFQPQLWYGCPDQYRKDKKRSYGQNSSTSHENRLAYVPSQD